MSRAAQLSFAAYALVLVGAALMGAFLLVDHGPLPHTIAAYAVALTCVWAMLREITGEAFDESDTCTCDLSRTSLGRLHDDGCPQSSTRSHAI
ncbi:hypothetical protein [Streptomyces sp. NPDC086782]|uniref:hypothetical protein n=1 Tax=Streptomyces sp. NPDC086782 TaxID=3365757 RepID=UPI003818B13A